MRSVANRQSEAKPVHGSCRWVVPLGEVGAGVLEIRKGGRADLYEVVAFREEGVIVGYRLNKVTGGKEAFYDIDCRPSWGWQCDCPDATFHPERPGGCKHVLALKAASAALGR